MDDRQLTHTMLEAETWAVVGANADPDRTGYQIYSTLKANGYRVYAVNPRHAQIDGDPCYPDLSSLPERPEVVDMVVSPEHGRAVVEEAGRLGVPYIWFQPGTHEPDLFRRARELGMAPLRHCVLAALGSR